MPDLLSFSLSFTCHYCGVHLHILNPSQPSKLCAPFSCSGTNTRANCGCGDTDCHCADCDDAALCHAWGANTRRKDRGTADRPCERLSCRSQEQLFEQVLVCWAKQRPGRPARRHNAPCMTDASTRTYRVGRADMCPLHMCSLLPRRHQPFPLRLPKRSRRCRTTPAACRRWTS